MRKIVCLVLLVFLLSASEAGAEEALFGRLSDTYENVRVERLIRSDLIVLDNGKKIRLIGIKAFDKARQVRFCGGRYL